MRYRLLGRSGLYVSELCLGTMTYGGRGSWEVMGNLGKDAVVDQLKVAYEAGVNFIDTANVYSLGESERLVGEAIKALALPRDELIVATKVAGVMTELPNGRGHSRYHLFNEVNASLKRLQLDYIDLYQLHGIDPLTPLEEALAALGDLVRAGKVRYIGLCNMAAWQIMKALSISERNGWPRVQSVQAHYTIAGRDVERELVPLILDQPLGLLVWSPLAGGLLTGKYGSDGKGPEGARRENYDFPVVDKVRTLHCINAMRPIAERQQISVAQVAIAWRLSKAIVSSVIVGARTTAQLRDNLAASRVKLSADDVRVLNEVSQLPQEYPEWMMSRQARNRLTRAEE